MLNSIVQGDKARKDLKSSNTPLEAVLAEVLMTRIPCCFELKQDDPSDKLMGFHAWCSLQQDWNLNTIILSL